MKKTIKINASVSATIATGSYQNLKPGFLIEETIEVDEQSCINVRKETKRLYDMVYGLVKEVENQAIIERIEREREDLRFFPSLTTGKPTPTVTGIIGFDADWFISKEELRQYASQSQIVHKKVENYIVQHHRVTRTMRDLLATISNEIIRIHGPIKKETKE